MVETFNSPSHPGSYYTGKRVLVTGGYGFVGSHLVKQLVFSGAQVTVLDINTSAERESLLNDPIYKLREKIITETGDVEDRKSLVRLLKDGDFEIIFHLAASAAVIEKAVQNPFNTINTNTMGLVNLLEAIRTGGKWPDKIFFSSTDKVYGELDGISYDEATSPLFGEGLYEASKLSADVFSRTYYKVFGIPTVTLRMCNIIGPYDFNTEFRVIPRAMHRLYGSASPQAPELYTEALNHWRDYLYIDDAVRAIMLLAGHTHCSGQAFNLVGCRNITTPSLLKLVVELAANLEERFDLERTEIIRRNGLVIKDVPFGSKVITIRKQHQDGLKLKTAAGFSPVYTLEEALTETISFYRDYYQQQQALQSELKVLAS